MPALAWFAGWVAAAAAAEAVASGGNAYVAVPQANAVAAYRVKSGSGDLKARAGFAFQRRNFSGFVAVHPSGKFVYTANQGGNDISLFTVDSNTGELTEVLPRTPAGLNPTALVMDSGGDLLFVAQSDLEHHFGLFHQFERWHA